MKDKYVDSLDVTNQCRKAYWNVFLCLQWFLFPKFIMLKELESNTPKLFAGAVFALRFMYIKFLRLWLKILSRPIF